MWIALSVSPKDIPFTVRTAKGQEHVLNPRYVQSAMEAKFGGSTKGEHVVTVMVRDPFRFEETAKCAIKQVIA